MQLFSESCMLLDALEILEFQPFSISPSSISDMKLITFLKCNSVNWAASVCKYQLPENATFFPKSFRERSRLPLAHFFQTPLIHNAYIAYNLKMFMKIS